MLTVIKEMLCCFTHAVKPVYKDHSREPENVAFIHSLKFALYIYMLKLYALSIIGKNETTLYKQWFAI